MRRLKISLLAMAATVAGFAAPALADAISVPLDQVRVVSFNEPVSTVYVGNPAIADVTVIDSHRVFVLGKAFGATNVIALDRQGKQIADKPLTVNGRSADMVTLNRGPNQVTYSCAGSRCETTPVPGDAPGAYQAEMGQITLHQELGQKAAIASAAQ